MFSDSEEAWKRIYEAHKADWEERSFPMDLLVNLKPSHASLRKHRLWMKRKRVKWDKHLLSCSYLRNGHQNDDQNQNHTLVVAALRNCGTF